MSRCFHVYPFVARNHGGIPFSGVCPTNNVDNSTIEPYKNRGLDMHVVFLNDSPIGLQPYPNNIYTWLRIRSVVCWTGKRSEVHVQSSNESMETK